MLGNTPGMRSDIVSHALDDISVCASDDDCCSVSSIDSSLQRPRSPPSTLGDEADVLAIVSSQDQTVPSGKYSFTTTKKQKPASKPVLLQQSANVSIVPVKPLKWQLRLADRATAGVNLEAHYQIPPNVLFDLLADPLQHETIFDEIEAADAELLEDNGAQKKWRLDYTARWSFWKVSGVCENRLWMWTDRDAGTVKFQLREPGFLRRYEGTWTIKPACGTPMSACYAPADAVAASSVSSSAYSTPMSSPPISPKGISKPSSPWGSFSSNSRLDAAAATPAASSVGSLTAGSGVLISPLASVSVMDAGAGLKGAVAAIARMQASFLESLNNSASNFSSLASNAASSISNSTGLPALSALPSLGVPRPISINRDDDDNSSRSSRSQQQRPPRQLPTSAVITAETLTSPKVTPPYPLNSLLKNQSKGQVDDMLQGLVRAAVNKLQPQPLQGV